MGLGWLNMVAAERAQAGIAPATIAEEVRAAVPRANVWAALDT